MDIADVKERFVNEIKLRAYVDKFINRNEEREILQIAIRLGVNIDSARLAMEQVCFDYEYVQESTIARLMKDQLAASIADDGKLDRKEFDVVFLALQKAMKGRKSDPDIKRMMVRLLEETTSPPIKTGWFNDWYTTLKRELGLMA